MAQQGFELKWQDHLREVFTLVQKLRSRAAYSDVIVHCGGTNFFAHKVFLAASSAFFERVLDSLPEETTKVLVMTDVRPDFLRLVLDFIYNGEAFIEADLLEDFMRTAEKLEVRGLKQDDEETATKDVRSNAGKRDVLKRPLSTSASPMPSGDDNGSLRSRDGEDPTSKRLKPIAPVKRSVHSTLNVDSHSSVGSSTNAVDPLSDVVESNDERPAANETLPSSSHASKNSHPPPFSDDDVIEVEQEESIKREKEDVGYEDTNDGVEGDEWGEEGGYGDGEYYDESQYDENAGGEGEEAAASSEIPEQPLSIPPEISPGNGLVLWKRGLNIWKGVDAVTGRARFLCGYCCQYSSGKSSNCRVHSLKHTRERPHVCQWCLRGFIRNDHLAKHAVAECPGRYLNRL